MSAKVTMQDIADALGFSRNTVSKAINNTGVISPTTKELILKKAAEMGYRNIAGAGIISDPAQTSRTAGTSMDSPAIPRSGFFRCRPSGGA